MEEMQAVSKKEIILKCEPEKKVYMTDILIGCILLFVLFRGFIENFLGNGTLYVDFFFLILLIWTIYTCVSGNVFKHRKILAKFFGIYFLWIFLCGIVSLLQVLTNNTTFYDAVIGLRNNCVYTGLFFITAVRLDITRVKSLYSLFINCGVFICLFAISQYIFRNYYPDSLLFLNDEGNFGFYGEDAIRVTGLMGNTIIFGGFSIVLFSLIWSQIINNNYKSIALWTKLIIVAIANYLTFSRASIVGMVGVFVLEYLIDGISKKKYFKTFLTIFLFFLIAIVMAFTFFRDTIIIQRLFEGDNLWNSGSDAGHFSMIQDAVQRIQAHWLIGSLMGKSNEVITDGTFWAYLLEMGIPVFIVYCVLVFALNIFALKNCKSKDRTVRTLSMGYVGMNAYLLLSSFINSAYSARSVIVFVWFVGGMMLAAVISHNRKMRGEEKRK